MNDSLLSDSRESHMAVLQTKKKKGIDWLTKTESTRESKHTLLRFLFNKGANETKENQHDTGIYFIINMTHNIFMCQALAIFFYSKEQTLPVIGKVYEFNYS